MMFWNKVSNMLQILTYYVKRIFTIEMLLIEIVVEMLIICSKKSIVSFTIFLTAVSF